MKWNSLPVLFLLAQFAGADALAAEIKIATFNTESDGDTQPLKVAKTIRSVLGVDIWALQEVESGEALWVYRYGIRLTVAARVEG